VLGRDGFNGAEVIDAGVVYEYFDGAEFLYGLCDEWTDGVWIGEVGLDGDRFATGRMWMRPAVSSSLM
jgi:hypothetical protein